MEYQLADQKVRRVLECLRDNRRRTITEITEKYNLLYPPSLIGKLIGRKTTEQGVSGPLRFLVKMKEGYVEKHILYFTDRPHTVPVIQYSLTNAGFQYLSSLR